MSVINHSIPFERFHGTGNDFIIVDADAPIPNRGAFADAHCDRETGVGAPDADHADESAETERADGADDTADADAADAVGAAETDGGTAVRAGEAGGDAPSPAVRPGADGVLFLGLEERFSPPRIVMTLVQPDGSVAAMCGNGARCAAAWAARQTGATEFMIDTPAGTRRAEVHGDAGAAVGDSPADDGDPVGETDASAVTDAPDEPDVDVTIEMGVPSFRPRDVPLAREEELVTETVAGLAVTAVDTGVPHAVAFVEDAAALEDLDLAEVAFPVRHADVFPEGANVTVVAPDDDGGFHQRTYERGVEGETDSCGTGAVAAVAAAKRLGRLDDAEGAADVRVRPPGGELRVTVPDRGPARLRGPVVREFDGELPARPR